MNNYVIFIVKQILNNEDVHKNACKIQRIIKRYLNIKKLKMFFKRWKYKHKILKAEYIINTPVNTKAPMIDYFNQKIKYYNTLNRMIWDDSKYNNAKIGNLFSFVKGDKMEIHEIKKILDYTHRDKSWVIREHAQRNVLVLSHRYHIMSFMEYKKKVGYKENHFLRGTSRMRW